MLYISHLNEGYRRRVTRGWVSLPPNDTIDWAILSTGESVTILRVLMAEAAKGLMREGYE
ncbi:uncharacterized protein LY79DRAFT_548073 [Colletotrichum navitas]|uniref:Uncharacterized protein n=1 Tax=Colletotrichum navitas TaxID=681940 RepID=A0AAD8Q3U5_9PEZI|nr:uncharacterized protein LY79DRAFT_548073 [Colletotrichum navitas]KAK1595090.1 hypothetical protein LY79DRAFT_548073 [Colletotrichum navitas]